MVIFWMICDVVVLCLVLVVLVFEGGYDFGVLGCLVCVYVEVLKEMVV